MTTASGVNASDRRSLAVVGDFSSGKSAVINLIARRHVATSGVGIEGPNGSRYELGDDAAFPIVIEARTNDDGVPPSEFLEEIEDADLMIWCTIGSQAWRANEVSTVKGLSANRSGPSILVVTRADLFRNAKDIAKVEKRLNRAARTHFADIIFIDASPEANASANDEKSWQNAGGAALTRVMEKALEKTTEKAVSPAPEAVLPEPGFESYETGDAATATDCEEYLSEDTAESHTKITAMPMVAPEKTRPGDTASNSVIKGVNEDMSTDISQLANIAGFLGACMVDSETGLMLASEGGGAIDLETAGAANTEVVKAKLRAIEALGMEEGIEDILITLGSQFHLIRPLASNPQVFIYVALEKKAANLGLARIQVKTVEKTLVF